MLAGQEKVDYDDSYLNGVIRITPNKQVCLKDVQLTTESAPERLECPLPRQYAAGHIMMLLLSRTLSENEYGDFHRKDHGFRPAGVPSPAGIQGAKRRVN